MKLSHCLNLYFSQEIFYSNFKFVIFNTRNIIFSPNQKLILKNRFIKIKKIQIDDVTF